MDAQLDDIHAIEQVFAKFSLGNQLRQVFMRGGQDPDIDADFELLADAAAPPFPE